LTAPPVEAEAPVSRDGLDPVGPALVIRHAA
jgi:hypothetical protein